MANADATPAPEVPEESHEYRLPRQILHIAIFGLIVCGVFQIYEVTVGFPKADGAGERTVFQNFLVVICFSFPSLIGFYLIWAYSFFSVLLTSEYVRTKRFKTRLVRFDDIHEVVWKLFNGHGTILLRTPQSSVKLKFGGELPQERAEIAAFIRASLPDCCEIGWEQTKEYWQRGTNLERQRKFTRSLRRLFFILWTLSMPALYWAFLNGQGKLAVAERAHWGYVVAGTSLLYATVVVLIWIATEDHTSEYRPLNLVPISRRNDAAPATTDL